MKLTGDPQAMRRAKTLRSEMLLPEVILWQALRQRPAGQFRRQHPAGLYIADFYCFAMALVVEVDGEAHERGDQFRRDDARDRWFAKAGIRVLRIPARDVLNNLEGVVIAIVECALNPPPEGEDL